MSNVSKITLPNGSDINIKDSTAVRGLSSGTNQNNLVKWGSDGYTVADAGVAIQSDTISTQDNTKVPTNKAVASFVNSSVATNTANFVGTYKSLAELQAVQNPTNNDYGFVSTVDSAILTTSQPADWTTNYTDYYTYSGGVYTPVTGSSAPTWQADTYYKADNLIFSRYKYVASSTTWTYEYELNNSSFTAAEWDTIQSGLSANDKEKLDSLATIKSVGSGLGLNGTTGELTADVIGVKGDSESNYRTGNVNITKSNIGLGNVTNDAQVKKISSSTSGNIMTWSGTTGDTPADSGVSIETSSSGISDSDAKIPTSKDIRNNAAGSATLTGYTKATGDVNSTDTITAAIGKLETKADANTSILSQTYNSADCNVSVFLRQDNGAIDESTYYNTSESKMHFRMHWSKNQLVYWDVEDEVYTNKYRYEYFGVIATNNVNKSTWLTIDIPEVANETYVKKTTTTDTTNLPNVDHGGYTWNKSSVNVGDIWYIRPYVVMTDLQFGNQFIKYGAVYKVTAGVPCTIECDTLSCTELTTNTSLITPALIECVDNGKKNLLELTCPSSGNLSGVTYIVNDAKSITATGTCTAVESLLLGEIIFKRGQYILSGSPNAHATLQLLKYDDASNGILTSYSPILRPESDNKMILRIAANIDTSIYDAVRIGIVYYKREGQPPAELILENVDSTTGILQAGKDNAVYYSPSMTDDGYGVYIRPYVTIRNKSTSVESTSYLDMIYYEAAELLKLRDSGNGAVLDITSDVTRKLIMVFEQNYTYNNFTLYPMICEKSLWDVSQKYVPYAMDNVELTSMLGNINTVLEGVL